MQIIRLSSAGVSEDYAFPVETLKELIEIVISKKEKETEIIWIIG